MELRSTELALENDHLTGNKDRLLPQRHICLLANLTVDRSMLLCGPEMKEFVEPVPRDQDNSDDDAADDILLPRQPPVY